MAQVYILLYDENKNVLVAKKNKYCSVWGGKNKGRRTLVNGGGRYCYPGGKLDKGTEPIEGACKEFMEETGNANVSLFHFAQNFSEKAYTEKKFNTTLYHVVFVKLSGEGLKKIAKMSNDHIRFNRVQDEELEFLEVVNYQRAMEIFGDANDRIIGWFTAPTIDLGNMA